MDALHLKRLNDDLRRQSGKITSDKLLVAFLYDLLISHLPAGTAMKLMADALLVRGDTVTYTNGYAAAFAKYIAGQLTQGDPRDMLERVRSELPPDVLSPHAQAAAERLRGLTLTRREAVFLARLILEQAASQPDEPAGVTTVWSLQYERPCVVVQERGKVSAADLLKFADAIGAKVPQDDDSDHYVLRIDYDLERKAGPDLYSTMAIYGMFR